MRSFGGFDGIICRNQFVTCAGQARSRVLIRNFGDKFVCTFLIVPVWACGFQLTFVCNHLFLQNPESTELSGLPKILNPTVDNCTIYQRRCQIHKSLDFRDRLASHSHRGLRDAHGASRHMPVAECRCCLGACKVWISRSRWIARSTGTSYKAVQ